MQRPFKKVEPDKKSPNNEELNRNKKANEEEEEKVEIRSVNLLIQSESLLRKKDYLLPVKFLIDNQIMLTP